MKDGRLIYAPQDIDQVIRLRGEPQPTDPPSPEYEYPQDDEDFMDEDEEGDEGEGEHFVIPGSLISHYKVHEIAL